MTAAAREGGTALVLVLVVALLLGLAATALAFTVTLDALAARNLQEAALAEGLAEGALQLAASQIGERLASGTSPPRRLGPWPGSGVDATAEAVPAGPDQLVITSEAAVGRSSVTRTLVVAYDPAGLPTVVARP